MSDWLSRRTPAPPPELAAAIRAALGGSAGADDPTPTQLLEAAQALLQEVLDSECAQRDSALDLLTADALVTYALEIANEGEQPLGEFAERAMKVLAEAPS